MQEEAGAAEWFASLGSRLSNRCTGNTMRFHGMRMHIFASFSRKGSGSRAWQVRGYLGWTNLSGVFSVHR